MAQALEKEKQAAAEGIVLSNAGAVEQFQARKTRIASLEADLAQQLNDLNSRRCAILTKQVGCLTRLAVSCKEESACPG